MKSSVTKAPESRTTAATKSSAIHSAEAGLKNEGNLETRLNMNVTGKATHLFFACDTKMKKEGK